MKIWLVRLQKVLPDFHTFSVMCMRDNIYQNFILCGGGGVGVLGRMGGGGVSKLVAGPTFQNILPKFHTFSVSKASCIPDFTIIIQILIMGRISLEKSQNINALNPDSVLCINQALLLAFGALNPWSALNPSTLNPGTTARSTDQYTYQEH